ncbi:MotA/TolQ/ExbB proton channel family protein [Limnobacter humi]|uniref:Biopolymer transport protein ExbB n=1 Tax=Limnobacter humi TaxID=1778671 RepID=A0ABT1WII6_9BURK|nr:MotA/TolQ/ExbB proton channel family protein [Limnobacter humi]MCQ8896693.1 MotA/TolQ/ExbB proton channel family protein [Limnobacter humi]
MDSNPYGLAAMWAQGDWVIKAVALVLLVMSIASWTVIVARSLRLISIKKAAAAVDQFWHTHSFAEGLQVLGKVSGNPFLNLAMEAQAAVNHHTTNQDDLHGQMNLADWLSEALRGAMDDAVERLQAGLSILASVGSTAPFVGLFGTVWGIYHALVGIGVSGQASIDKVAGPVGEALIMTAFGLAVAIPAVLGYNALTRGNKGVVGRLNRFSRQLHAYFLTGSPLKKDSAVRTVPLQRQGN